jgi:small subunit ribosomal protein S9
LSDLTYHGVGRRKTSVARVWLKPGNGSISINKKEFDKYFVDEYKRGDIIRPLEITGTMGKYDIYVNVNGGGKTGQAEAMRLGISRALLKVSEDFRRKLSREGLLTRDPRMKERKKYGKKGARASFQYSKR